jgi:glucosamine-6-phosphate deaminase
MTVRSSISSPGTDLNVEIIGADQWATAVSDGWSSFLSAKPEARMCIPTGATPRPAYRRFAQSGGDLSATTVFLLDEFGLPPHSAARCDVTIRRDLIALLDKPPRAFDAIDVQAPDLEAECHRYEAALRSDDLDLAILGLGGNGHLGLNEPGSGLTSTTRIVQLSEETRRNAETYGPDAPPGWGITIGIDTLLAAKVLWLLVTGSHKAEILSRTLHGDIGPELPATFLRTHPNVTVWADEPASALL